MKWKGRAGSANVDDRRGASGGGMGKIGAPLGCGGLIIIIIVMLLGGDPTQFLQEAQVQQPTEQGQRTPQSAESDELAAFVSVVLKETEDVWDKIFREQLGKQYEQPVLVLFDGQVSSACGNASSATGPFYCPGDHKLYIDLSFARDLRTNFDAPGDFPLAYVVAHEVAHHVQNLLGYTRMVDQQRGRISETAQNQLSVRLELQADFLAGVWARNVQSKGLLDEGDFEEAMRAAHQIGDDRIQKAARGYVVPEQFTHGTSQQRMRWFRKGYETGDISQGDTFRTDNL